MIGSSVISPSRIGNGVQRSRCLQNLACKIGIQSVWQ
jgi:hypothetical protein